MKLSNFKFEQLSTSELQNVMGGVEVIADEGSSQTTRHSTSCTGTDHDAGRHDSD